MKPKLYIFSGLPATGKSTLARQLAQTERAVWLRIDTIEQSLRDLCAVKVQGEGYALAYRIALDNLNNGIDVVADSCNPVELTRLEWNNVARKAKAIAVNIEIICSNHAEHRQRAEHRNSEIPGMPLPSWDKIQTREYQQWTKPHHLTLDTAGRTAIQSSAELIKLLQLA